MIVTRGGSPGEAVRDAPDLQWLVPNNDLDGYIAVIEATNEVYISFVASQRKGALKELIEHLWANGYTVKVPTPFRRMREILIKQRFVPTIERDEEFGDVDVWVKGPPNTAGDET